MQIHVKTVEGERSDVIQNDKNTNKYFMRILFGNKKISDKLLFVSITRRSFRFTFCKTGCYWVNVPGSVSTVRLDWTLPMTDGRRLIKGGRWMEIFKKFLGHRVQWGVPG